MNIFALVPTTERPTTAPTHRPTRPPPATCGGGDALGAGAVTDAACGPGYVVRATAAGERCQSHRCDFGGGTADHSMCCVHRATCGDPRGESGSFNRWPTGAPSTAVKQAAIHRGTHHHRADRGAGWGSDGCRHTNWCSVLDKGTDSQGTG